MNMRDYPTLYLYTYYSKGSRRGRMVAGFTTTCVIRAYHH